MSHVPGTPPAFTSLDDTECRAILRRNHLGRIAFLNHRAADIVPVTYAATGDWVYLRSAQGTKVEAFAHSPFVALEVDEVDSPSNWRSVVAHGTIYFLSDDGTESRRNTYESAVEALRSVSPGAFTDNDPTPFRQIVYGIHLDRWTGRMATNNAVAGRDSTPAPSAVRKVPGTTDGS